MKLKITLISILFLIVSLGDIYAVLSSNRGLEIVFKPLIIIVLAVLYILHAKKVNIWYVLALFFSFLGDFLLLFPHRFFVFGLLSFLITHLILIKIILSFLSNIKKTTIFFSSLCYGTYFTIIFLRIKDSLGALIIPVLIYGIVISIMGIVSFLNFYENKRAIENIWLLVGASVFILSDSILAINKFYKSSMFFGVAIMITYIIAQYIIYKGMVIKSENK